MNARVSASAGWLSRRFAPVAVVAAAVLLAGCNSTTYGTGTPTGMQTMRDIAGISGVSTGQSKKAIDYGARPPVVLPPDGAVLPPPGSGNQAVAAVDWPDDPDERAAEFRRQRDARAASLDSEARPLNANSPRFRLPAGSQSNGAPNYDPSADEERPRGSGEEDQRARAAFAAAKSSEGYDADGNPVRRYLSDPPLEYRLREDEPVPDPNAPTTVAAVQDCKPPPAIRLPWRRPKPGECEPGQGS